MAFAGTDPVTSALLPTYARADLAFERGEGAWLISTKGERFLDFGCGIAVTALGHAHPHLVEALIAQGQRLWHTPISSNPAGRAARRAAGRLRPLPISSSSPIPAQRRAKARSRRRANTIMRVAIRESSGSSRFEGAFHGRSLAALSAGGNAKYLEGFGREGRGFDQVPFGDLDAVEAAVGRRPARS